MPVNAEQTVVPIDSQTAATPKRVPAPAAANPELTGTRRRRSFSAKEKLRILEEADQAAASGEAGAVGVILRREGIYSSMLTTWRRQREAGALQALAPTRRGPKPEPVNPLDAEVKRLMRENTGLKERLNRAEQIIDLQKKVSELLAIPLQSQSSDGSI